MPPWPMFYLPFIPPPPPSSLLLPSCPPSLAEGRAWVSDSDLEWGRCDRMGRTVSSLTGRRTYPTWGVCVCVCACVRICVCIPSCTVYTLYYAYTLYYKRFALIICLKDVLTRQTMGTHYYVTSIIYSTNTNIDSKLFPVWCAVVSVFGYLEQWFECGFPSYM